MNIAQISIRRPVFVVMLMAFFVVVGMVSCSKLGLNMMPKVKIPYITVMTIYPGASPDVIATEITKKIEDRVAVVEGIDTLTSYSMEGVSVVVIKFVSGKDVETAAQDVRDKVALARADLPDTVEDPTIGKVDLNAMPIMTYTLSSDTMGERELRDYVRTQIVDSLQQVSGVASVSIQGGLEREIRVVLDPARMDAYGLNPSLVGQMLLATNVNFPAGTIRQGGLEYALREPNEYKSVEAIRETVVSSTDGMTVRLGDIATISDSQKEQTVAARLNGKSSVNLEIVQRSDADTVTTAEGTKRKVEVLKSQMPPGIKMLLTSDYSRYVVSALEDIQFSIILGAILASFSVWLFVGKMRHTIPITISILVSIIAAYSVINFAGFTLNFISMLALAVAVGLVVDDAIVVQENLLKVHEQTEDREKATVQGVREVALAVLAATSTLIAVFLPIGFMTGMIGQFFKEFGVTVAAAVAISLVVSLVLIPLIFYHFTSTAHHEGERGFFLRIIDFFSRLFNPIHLGFLRAYLLLEGGYEGFLRTALRRRAMVVAIAAGFFLLTIPLLGLVQVGFLPPSDQGTFSINIELPVEADFTSTDAIVRKVEARVKELPEVENVVSLVGSSSGGHLTGGTSQSNTGSVMAVMMDKKLRKVHWRWWGIIPVPYRNTSFDLVERTRGMFNDIPGAKITAASEGEGPSQHAVQLTFADTDYERLRNVTSKAQEMLANIPGAVNVDNSERPGKLEMRIIPSLQKMAQLGITPAQLGQYMRILYNGEQFGSYREGGEEYDITLIFPEGLRRDLQSVKSLKVYSSKLEQSIALDSIADIQLGQGPSIIQHLNKIRSIDVHCDVTQGVGGGSIVSAWQTQMKKGNTIPPTTQVTAIGESQMIGEMFEQFFLAIMLGVIFTYMVLASQFNSYKHPFTIMMTVPLATTGTVLTMIATGKSLNLMTFLGIVMLIGLVTKNGILLVDFANQARDKGAGVADALVTAGVRRMRPILMTSFTTILALLPTAFSLSEGADMRSPLAVAVIGGMLFSTPLTLVVIPVVYSLIEGRGGGRPEPKAAAVE
ncbi:MAG: hypothetical protein A2Y63_03850 [Candidatus Riflebacteria bacterium RBG_13_59_9]|nr:MAG: hypothetical protein A2Y63_03850 [Candidatus Riflebacteria bacterium RBG_13_59_9]